MPTTPGMAIGLATPAIAPLHAAQNSQRNPILTPTAEEGSQLERSQTERSSGHEADYFSRTPVTNGKPQGSTEGSQDGTQEANPQSPAAEDTPTAQQKKTKAIFSKRFNMTFNVKKFGNSAAEAAKPAVAEEKAEDSDSKSSQTDDKAFEDNFFGGLQRTRQSYEEQVQQGATKIDSLIAPSLPNETPVLKPPASTVILIQEDRPDSGGVADLFEGRVGNLGRTAEADLIEKKAPLWLADVLLRVCRCVGWRQARKRRHGHTIAHMLTVSQNQIPLKDIVKVSFILEPHAKSPLPAVATDG